MSRRADTLFRYALFLAGGAALVAMLAVAGNEGLDRNARFALLVTLGGLVLVGWPGTALTQAYGERRPLRMKWGKTAATGGLADPDFDPTGSDPP